MALSSQELSTLYKKYLGRDLTPQQLAEVQDPTGKYASYNTTDKMAGLLQSTAQSTKQKALANIDSNINSLKSGTQIAPQTSMFSGKLPDYSTYLNQNSEYTNAVNQQNQDLSAYDILTQKEAVAPSKTKDILKAGASLFGDSYQDIQKKYTDPSSPYFISDPDMQLKVIAQAEDTKYTTMNDIVGKVTDAYKLLTTAAANQLAGNKDKVDRISKSMEKSYDALMSYYGQEMADRTARENQDTQFAQQKELAKIQHGYQMEETRLIHSYDNSKVIDPAEGYKVIQNKDDVDNPTGFTFIDPNGLPVAPAKFAALKGVTIDSVLQGSSDPQDRKIVQLIQTARNAGASEDSINADLEKLYPHLFGQTSENNMNSLLNPGRTGVSSFVPTQ
jgi:hypothetical protein